MFCFNLTQNSHFCRVSRQAPKNLCSLFYTLTPARVVNDPVWHCSLQKTKELEPAAATSSSSERAQSSQQPGYSSRDKVESARPSLHGESCSNQTVPVTPKWIRMKHISLAVFVLYFIKWRSTLILNVFSQLVQLPFNLPCHVWQAGDVRQPLQSRWKVLLGQPPGCLLCVRVIPPPMPAPSAQHHVGFGNKVVCHMLASII